MKKIILVLLPLFFIMACKNKQSFMYPITKTVDSVEDFFGTQVPDPYQWMENEDDPALKKWIEDENYLTETYLSKIPYRQKIKDRLSKIYNYEKVSAPFKKGGKYFFYKNDGLQNQYVLFVKDNLDDSARVLIDPNTLSEDGTVALSTTAVSKDGKYIAYSIAKSGSDWNEIFVKEIETGKILDDHLLWVKFSGISWYKDGFFYSRFDEPVKGTELTVSNTNQKVFYHKVNTDQSQDILVYKDANHPTYGFGADVSSDEQYIFLNVWKGTSGNIVYFAKLTDDLANLQFTKLNNSFDYDYVVIDEKDGKLLINTNKDAPNYKIVQVDVNNSEESNWVDLIPESDDVLVNVKLCSDYIITTYLHDVKGLIKLFDYNGKYVKDIKMPGIGSIVSLSANNEDNFFFYKFSSYTIPGTIYKYDFSTNETSVFYETKFSGIDLSNYTVEQVFYKSKDGTKIPMFLVHKKNIELNGQNPVWLYGYGGFNISLTPYFDVKRLIWLENGGIFAVANLRGGGEYGEKWHKAGMLMNKQNVFDDFIAAAEYLIDKKYTNSDKLVIEGRSNGGLLIGAVLNQHPDLFKVAFPGVGVMDMLHYWKFTIGRAWASDYGLPTESKEMFEYIYKYSPYHNIKKGKVYPSIMVNTADHDDRVVPAHSFKYIARLQSICKDNPNPLFIRIDTKAGHGGGKPTSKIIDEWTDMYSFAFYNLGITID